MTREKVLFVDDEEHLRIAGGQTLELADFDVRCFATGDDVLKQISKNFDGVLVSDIRMPGMTGVELLEQTLAIDPEIPVVLVTGHGDVEMAVECIKIGAYDFIEKPWQADRLVNSVSRAAERRRLILENRALRGQLQIDRDLKEELFGRSASIEQVRQSIAAIADTDVNVLLTGKTGTGKEVAARSLHRKSARKDGPFVHINCAALPEALMENELFGHCLLYTSPSPRDS